MIILVLSKQITKDCDNNLYAPGIAIFVSELISFFPTVFYGLNILKNMIKKQKIA
jgi:hypothetical protein